MTSHNKAKQALLARRSWKNTSRSSAVASNDENEDKSFVNESSVNSLYCEEISSQLSGFTFLASTREIRVVFNCIVHLSVFVIRWEGFNHPKLRAKLDLTVDFWINDFNSAFRNDFYWKRNSRRTFGLQIMVCNKREALNPTSSSDDSISSKVSNDSSKISPQPSHKSFQRLSFHARSSTASNLGCLSRVSIWWIFKAD